MADYLKITAAEAGEMTVEEFYHWNAYAAIKEERNGGQKGKA
jgi:hypothetical protein